MRHIRMDMFWFNLSTLLTVCAITFIMMSVDLFVGGSGLVAAFPVNSWVIFQPFTVVSLSQSTLVTYALISALLAGLVSGIRLWSSQRHAVGSEGHLRARLALSSLQRPMSVSRRRDEDNQTGSIVSMMTDGVERFTVFRHVFIPQLLGALLVPLIVVLWVGIWIDVLIALALVVAVPAIPLSVRMFSRATRKASSSSRRERMRLSSAYLDAIEGMDTLQLTGASRAAAQRLAQQGERNRRSVMRLLSANQLVLFVIDMSFSLVMVCVSTVMVALRAHAGVLSPGQIVAMMLLTIVMIEPIDQVGAFFYVGMGGMAAYRSLTSFLNRYPATSSHQEQMSSPLTASAQSQPEHPQAACDEAAADDVLLVDDVSLTYPASSSPVFSHLSVTIKRGERVALTGASGEGKSSLLAVMAGLVQPTEGAVMVRSGGAQSFTPVTATHCAVVWQTPWLYAGTVAENLRCVAPQASEDHLWAALDAAHVGQEIRRMPAGLDTVVGDDSFGLSGGQAQRVALARALLSGRTTILLDEPTSAVDHASALAITQALSELPPHYTLVMVTHRSELLACATRHLRLSTGHLEEVTHG